MTGLGKARFLLKMNKKIRGNRKLSTLAAAIVNAIVKAVDAPSYDNRVGFAIGAIAQVTQQPADGIVFLLQWQEACDHLRDAPNGFDVASHSTAVGWYRLPEGIEKLRRVDSARRKAAKAQRRARAKAETLTIGEADPAIREGLGRQKDLMDRADAAVALARAGRLSRATPHLLNAIPPAAPVARGATSSDVLRRRPSA